MELLDFAVVPSLPGHTGIDLYGLSPLPFSLTFPLDYDDLKVFASFFFRSVPSYVSFSRVSFIKPLFFS